MLVKILILCVLLPLISSIYSGIDEENGKIFIVEKSCKNGDPDINGLNPSAVEMGDNHSEYIVEFVMATMIGPNQIAPKIWIKFNSGNIYHLPIDRGNQVKFYVRPNEKLTIGVMGHSIGIAGETQSNLYVLYRKLN